MSYIIKNSTQGAIVARLTDAGRKKLSEGGELSEFYPRNAWSQKTEQEYSAWLKNN